MAPTSYYYEGRAADARPPYKSSVPQSAPAEEHSPRSPSFRILRRLTRSRPSSPEPDRSPTPRAVIRPPQHARHPSSSSSNYSDSTISPATPATPPSARDFGRFAAQQQKQPSQYGREPVSSYGHQRTASYGRPSTRDASAIYRPQASTSYVRETPQASTGYGRRTRNPVPPLPLQYRDEREVLRSDRSIPVQQTSIDFVTAAFESFTLPTSPTSEHFEPASVTGSVLDDDDEATMWSQERDILRQGLAAQRSRPIMRRPPPQRAS